LEKKKYQRSGVKASENHLETTSRGEEVAAGMLPTTLAMEPVIAAGVVVKVPRRRRPSLTASICVLFENLSERSRSFTGVEGRKFGLAIERPFFSPWNQWAEIFSEYFRVGRPSGPRGVNACAKSFLNSCKASVWFLMTSAGRQLNDIDEEGSLVAMVGSPIICDSSLRALLMRSIVGMTGGRRSERA